jgi:hypothetical protein
LSPKKHKLAISIEENYCLLGISSDEPDYKLCWLINQKLNFSLTRIDNISLYNKKLNSEQEISMFYYHEENTMLSYRIIVNQSNAGYFLADLRNIDYFLHIQGDINPDDISSLIKKVNSIPAIRMCVPVDLTKIKERDRLQIW